MWSFSHGAVVIHASSRRPTNNFWLSTLVCITWSLPWSWSLVQDTLPFFFALPGMFISGHCPAPTFIPRSLADMRLGISTVSHFSIYFFTNVSLPSALFCICTLSQPRIYISYFGFPTRVERSGLYKRCRQGTPASPHRHVYTMTSPLFRLHPTLTYQPTPLLIYLHPMFHARGWLFLHFLCSWILGLL
jgi:hypothetical protein